MVFVYPAIFHEEEGYWVEFPDLPGCQTYGDNLNSTVKCAQEALAGYLLTMLAEDRRVPVPTHIQEIDQIERGFVTLISCDIDQYRDSRAVKKTLTIPAWLNDLAMERNFNFSQILQEALLSRLQVK